LNGRIYEGFVPGRHAIDAYGAGGFRFADMSHRGSILALPSGIKAWGPTEGRGLEPEDFDDVFAEREAVELLLLGSGRDIVPVSEAVRQRFREAGIRFDPMQTGAAARTYNILLSENRRVAAALIAVE
jgi:uncharacterized protein